MVLPCFVHLSSTISVCIWYTLYVCMRSESLFESEVLALHDEMRRCGIEIGGFIHHAVAQACASTGAWQRSLELEQCDSAAAHEWQRVLHLDGAQWERALDLKDTAKRFGTEPSLFNLGMASCAAAGQWGTVHLLFEEMQKKGISMDAESYRLSIFALQ